jgi:hypothetical protein
LNNNGAIEKIELFVLNNDEIIVIFINEAYWETILNIITTAEYDDGQYGETRNPSGYMLKIKEQDYTIKIFYMDNTVDEILIWIDSNRIKINGKWYTMKDGKEELFNIINYSKL